MGVRTGDTLFRAAIPEQLSDRAVCRVRPLLHQCIVHSQNISLFMVTNSILANTTLQGLLKLDQEIVDRSHRIDLHFEALRIILRTEPVFKESLIRANAGGLRSPPLSGRQRMS
jgi:hypothetical protein